MSDNYPRWVHKTDPRTNGTKDFLVQNEAEHLQRFPEDHAKLHKTLADQEKSDETISALEAKERERCAQIAENHQRGNKIGDAIAAKIRKAGPSIDSLPATEPAAEPLPKAFQTAAAVVSKEYPKLLSNPTKSASAVGFFTVPNTDGTWTQPDRLVENAAEEAAARKLGFVVELPAPVSK